MLRSLIRWHPLRSIPSLLRFLHHPILKSPKEPATATATVSYLINSCGLSLSAALSAAKKVQFKSTANPDAVLALLKDHGFTKPQIANLVSKHPSLLAFRPQKTIKPKLDFFVGIGYSGADLGKLISADPNLLLASLEKKLVRNFDLLKTLLGSSEAVVSAVAGTSRLLRYDLNAMMLPNMETLRDHGVPGPKVIQLAATYPRVLMKKRDRFTETVELLKGMGMKPKSTMFILAINAMLGLTPATWERKLAVYRSLGWSEKETLLAFMKHPFCMLASDQNIRKSMEFFVNKLNWEPTFLAARPKLLSFSLEKRIIPRCSVLGVLLSKGLVRSKFGVHTLMITEKDFLAKYVIKYGKQIPEVLEAYQGKLEFVGIEAGNQCKQKKGGWGSKKHMEIGSCERVSFLTSCRDVEAGLWDTDKYSVR
ncbi:transcription termination factor MTERF8, chloroplastic isoform X2 [Elaeis guineensis]|uniref:Transcription termination factor MTERF2, chloroplastic isoform X2 n=1 Tax=Elaeis guineensis var. tenera TaxID=51953 RepID=A0A6I9Q933_ELAGV|nr:transcription termination factor MTERF2, chloroplastic isoform X2 [Elaeis guineensis]